MSKFSVRTEAVIKSCLHKATPGPPARHYTLNEPDDYQNIFPLLLPRTPISESGWLGLSVRACPRGINSSKAFQFGGGCLVWVDAIDSEFPRHAKYKRAAMKS